ncbi:MAG: thioredoxin [Candidatus Woesearchaeota archaeon]
MVLELTEKNFEQEVINSNVPVLVDFWAEWCSPCKEMAPKFENVSKKFQNRIKFAKLNVEQADKIPAKYGIRSIPCFIFFKNGKEVDRIIGSQPESTFAQAVENLLKH